MGCSRFVIEQCRFTLRTILLRNKLSKGNRTDTSSQIFVIIKTADADLKALVLHLKYICNRAVFGNLGLFL